MQQKVMALYLRVQFFFDQPCISKKKLSMFTSNLWKRVNQQFYK